MRRIQTTPYPKQARAEQERVRAYEQARVRSANRRLYSCAAWKALRADVLTDAKCSVVGCESTPTIVDHVIPHRGDQARFFDRANLQAMCKRHHDQKTTRTDGGFGRAALHPVPEEDEGYGFGIA